MARGIRDNERNGRPELVVIEEGSEPSTLTDVSLISLCRKFRDRTVNIRSERYWYIDLSRSISV